MRPSRRPHRFRGLLAIAVVLAATGVAGPTAASAQQPPSPGSVQSCVGVSGGFLLQMQGYGFDFPANTAVTTTFTFANGAVFELTATTDAAGIFRTDTFTLDLRDPELAALVGTMVTQTATFGSTEITFFYELHGCPTAPDGRVACMDGGFESYPGLGFLNQGDCVSWVATNGSNEPGKNQP